MKMGKIIEAVPALRKVSDLPLSLKTLYKLKILMLKLEHEIDFYNEERMKIIESLGDNVQGDQWKISGENRAKFDSKMDELINLEIDSEIEPVLLPVTEEIQLSYNELKALEGFVELDFVES